MNYNGGACYPDKNGDLVREYKHEDTRMFKWECHVYTRLRNEGIFPPAKSVPNKIIYLVNDHQKLRSLLRKTKSKDLEPFISELFAFVVQFGNLGFVHGNLHVDNIFVNAQGKYRAIDLVNSYLYDKQSTYTRSSFLGEWGDAHLSSEWDLFTLYISLKQYFDDSPKKLFIVNQAISKHIPIDVLHSLMRQYIQLNGMEFDDF
jgi:hypothetical protein